MTRRILFAAVALALAGCHEDAVPHSEGGDDGMNPGDRPTLRVNLDVDFSTVSALAFVNSPAGADSGSTPFRTGETSGLLAILDSGEIESIDLFEDGSTHVGIQAIHPTGDWIFLSTPGVDVTSPEGEDIHCTTFAVRRSDARLFCSEFNVAPSNWYDQYPAVQANAAGTFALALSRNALDETLLYRLDLTAAEGPVATLIDEFIHPRLFLLDADGDAFVSHLPSPLDPELVSLVYPASMAPAVAVSGSNNTYVVTGDVGSAEQNTFFIANGGSGLNFDGVLRRVRELDGEFVEDQFSLQFQDVYSYEDLLRLSDGVYMLSIHLASIVRVLEGGEVVANPVPIALEGVDEIPTSNLVRSYFGGDGLVMILGKSGSSHLFVRHDGQVQQNIPIPDNLALQRITYARSGAVNFIALDMSTSEYVRGSIAADSTEVVVAPADLLHPDDIVAFQALD